MATGVTSERRETPPTYILLMNLTDQGIREIKNAPQRIEQAIKGLEATGGKLIGFYTVMGVYDYVAVGEAPNDAAATTFLLGLGSQGNVRTMALKAFRKEGPVEIFKKLP